MTQELKKKLDKGAHVLRLACAAAFCIVVLVLFLPVLLASWKKGDGAGVIIAAVLMAFLCSVAWPSSE